jgi:hypothetical protein
MFQGRRRKKTVGFARSMWPFPKEKKSEMRLRAASFSISVLSVLTLAVTIGGAIAASFTGNGPGSDPELSERIEYQLFFKSLELPQNPGPGDYQEQKAGFDALGLSANDAKSFAAALLSFRDGYRELQEKFENGAKHDTAAAISYSSQVDALVDNTRNELKNSLSAAGLKAIELIISKDDELKRRAEQYVRWRGLRELQAQNENKAAESKSAKPN